SAVSAPPHASLVPLRQSGRSRASPLRKASGKSRRRTAGAAAFGTATGDALGPEPGGGEPRGAASACRRTSAARGLPTLPDGGGGGAAAGREDRDPRPTRPAFSRPAGRGRETGFSVRGALFS